jgi:hypothetical protein
LQRLLFVLQAEALLGVGAAVAAHPHETIAAIDGKEGSKALLTEALVAVLALDDAPDTDDLRLPWTRAECALALLQECLPVVQATHHVQDLLQAQATSREAARGGSGGGFLWSSSSSSGRNRTSAEDRRGRASASSLTVQDLGAVLLEGLVRGVARIEEQQQEGQYGQQREEARYEPSAFFVLSMQCI